MWVVGFGCDGGEKWNQHLDMEKTYNISKFFKNYLSSGKNFPVGELHLVQSLRGFI